MPEFVKIGGSWFDRGWLVDVVRVASVDDHPGRSRLYHRQDVGDCIEQSAPAVGQSRYEQVGFVEVDASPAEVVAVIESVFRPVAV